MMLDIIYNGVTLAYIGDAVIELAIREKLIMSGVTDTGRLSALAQKEIRFDPEAAIEADAMAQTVCEEISRFPSP